jgi:hypothetical protein
MVIIQTGLTLKELMAFYRAAMADKGVAEDTNLTVTTDKTLSMVFNGWTPDKILVVQSVDLGPSRTVTIRLDPKR